MTKFSTFSGIRAPRLSTRSLARYAVAKSARKSGAGYSRSRALSLLVLPWKSRKR